jgi:hypothetical protein
MARENPMEQATTQTVAKAFGLTDQAVAKWREVIAEDAGVWRWERTGGKPVVRWSLPRVIEWKIDRAAEAKAAAPAARVLSPIEQEQLRRLKRENDQRDGNLVNKAELEQQWARVGAELRQRLEGIGRRHGPAVANDIARTMAGLAQSMHGLIGKPG